MSRTSLERFCNELSRRLRADRVRLYLVQGRAIECAGDSCPELGMRGEPHWVPLHNEDSRPLGFLRLDHCRRDWVTADRDAIGTVLQSLSPLVSAIHREAELEALVRKLSHELNNNFAAALPQAELIALANDGKTADRARAIESSIRRADGLVRGALRALTSKQAGQKPSGPVSRRPSLPRR